MMISVGATRLFGGRTNAREIKQTQNGTAEGILERELEKRGE